MRHVALLGLRGAGKSSIGVVLAGLLELPFVDLDKLLAELEAGAAAPRSAGELLAELGEARFRELEARALRVVLDSSDPCVLATGGGVVLDPANRALLAECCRCVWLDVDPETLLARIQLDGAPRPPLTELQPLAELRQQAEERREHYAGLAEFTVDASKAEIDSLAAVIAARIGD
jgi:shikimate kinase